MKEAEILNKMLEILDVILINQVKKEQIKKQQAYAYRSNVY